MKQQRRCARQVTMDFDDVYQFFRSPPPTYLTKEQAVCYVLDVLLRQESYGTELIDLIERTHPGYRLSDTVLYSVLKFLEESGTISGYWKKLDRRGRTRRMYQIQPEARSRAEELSKLWQGHLAERGVASGKASAID